MGDALVFLMGVAAMLGGSTLLSRGLDRVGARVPISPGLLGLITALGADAPEIASATAAMLRHEHEVGVGVVLGSNLFNLAALLGLGGVLSGHLGIARSALLLHAVPSLLLTGIAALLVFRLLSPGWTMALLMALFVPYVGISWRRSGRPLEVEIDATPWTDARVVLTTLGSLGAIVGGAILAVDGAIALADTWGVPRSIVGSVVLAALSGVPNAYTSAHLARRGLGAAVASETVNSNTINIVVGLGLPALLFGQGGPSSATSLEMVWLLAMTLAVVVLPLPDRALGRWRGGLLVLAYLAFVVARISLAA